MPPSRTSGHWCPKLEVFNVTERWTDFARREIADWPTTKDLGKTQRTELITRIITKGESVLDHPQLTNPAKDRPSRVWYGLGCESGPQDREDDVRYEEMVQTGHLMDVSWTVSAGTGSGS